MKRVREKVKDFTFSERMNYITEYYNISEEVIVYVEDWRGEIIQISSMKFLFDSLLQNHPMKILNYMAPKC